MLAAAIARPAFSINGPRLDPSPEVPWPVRMAPTDSPYGLLPGDVPFLRGGIDILILGNACQPKGEVRPSLRVSVRVGAGFDRTIDVLGDRHWKESNGHLLATDPEPFESIPLTYERAYGGSAFTEAGDIQFQANRHGKGFYLTAEQAAGGPLPNLEDPAHRIQSWNDQPEPVAPGVYPLDGSLKPLNALDLDLGDPQKPQIREVKPLLFNHAHPKWIIDAGAVPQPGDAIEIHGVHASGALRFAIPSAAMHLHVQLENRNYTYPLQMDGITVYADRLLVVFSYRAVFRYRLVRFEKRVTTLYDGPVPPAVPPEYVHQWEQ